MIINPPREPAKKTPDIYQSKRWRLQSRGRPAVSVDRIAVTQKSKFATM